MDYTSPYVLIPAALVVLWVLLHMKTGRNDGTLVKVHPYRRLMFFIMPTRTESQVYFDVLVDAEKLLEYMPKAREAFGANMTHLVVAAGNIGLATAPRLNRFTLGKRLYQRKGRWLSFAMKRKKLDGESKLATVKMDMQDGETFAGLCERINGQIDLNRSGVKTHADKEFSLFNALPRPILAAATPLLARLDAFNLLPGFFIEPDPMYTSIFIANLGSLDMDPGYHHLYEYGNCPLFMMVGRVEDRVVAHDGQPVVRPVLPLRFTYDERVDDGLNARKGLEVVKQVLEDPERYLGCLAKDGTDAKPMGPAKG